MEATPLIESIAPGESMPFQYTTIAFSNVLLLNSSYLLVIFPIPAPGKGVLMPHLSMETSVFPWISDFIVL